LAEITFTIIGIYALVVVAYTLKSPQKLFEYPAAVMAVLLLWIMPQALVVVGVYNVPGLGMPLYCAMIVLSLIALHVGWRLPRKDTIRQQKPSSYNISRLIIGALLLSVFGAAFNIALRNVPIEIRQMGQWSGALTIYVTFAKTQVVALAILWLIYLRTRSKIALILAVLNFAFLAEMVFIGARRGLIINIVLILFGSLWLVRGWRPNGIAMVLALLGGMIFINSVTQFRAATNGRAIFGSGMTISVYIDAIKSVEYFNFSGFGEKPLESFEIVNGAYIVAARSRTLEFEGISEFWNILIHRYVPGQLVGHSLKDSLQFEIEDQALTVFGHYKFIGTVITGFGDAFRAFWFFGSLIFFVIARYLRRLYERARHGNMWAQFLYPMLLTDGLLAITHSTSWFIRELPFYFVFGGLVFLVARKWQPAQPAFEGNTLKKAVFSPS